MQALPGEVLLKFKASPAYRSLPYEESHRDPRKPCTAIGISPDTFYSFTFLRNPRMFASVMSSNICADSGLVTASYSFTSSNLSFRDPSWIITRIMFKCELFSSYYSRDSAFNPSAFTQHQTPRTQPFHDSSNNSFSVSFNSSIIAWHHTSRTRLFAGSSCYLTSRAPAFEPCTAQQIGRHRRES